MLSNGFPLDLLAFLWLIDLLAKISKLKSKHNTQAVVFEFS